MTVGVLLVLGTMGAAYGADVDKAHKLMREAAGENEHILNKPKPVVSCIVSDGAAKS